MLGGGTGNAPQPPTQYDPNYLDDPGLKADSRRTTSNLVGFVGSIIQHNKPVDVRRELNEHFRRRHGAFIDSSITLSKIRNLKLRLIQCAQQASNEISSVALAYVYLEKLILARRIHKGNRRCLAAACLLLAVKANEPHGESTAQLLAVIPKVMGVTSAAVLEQEFTVFADLQFSLYVPIHEFMPHLNRALRSVGISSVQEYVGGDSTFYLK
ncbi:hypothetical protein BJ085DRAFT_16375 [Dimargaris cristalligena]|uniref:Cyclin N-terminal domain-containing protein n=1 Tax=Dimargaris cristalligena TaxID=215637 RepID=A0A4P9ZYD2_9FUNG|nr:hypothetical protein BJ085DRAFT_16375 [Dimargaris cristalligena]|eukprot:RKP38703.1 hypothetical protein BJ085DRAFT_16375 [Dimargaris cristalligena]